MAFDPSKVERYTTKLLLPIYAYSKTRWDKMISAIADMLDEVLGSIKEEVEAGRAGYPSILLKSQAQDATISAISVRVSGFEELTTSGEVFKGAYDASVNVFPVSPVQGDYWVITVAGNVGLVKLYVGNRILYTNSQWVVIGGVAHNEGFPDIRPTFLQDFANTKQLDPRIVHTRESVGTYWDSSCSMQVAQSNVPRFTHDPVTGESMGLLDEGAATNLLLNSENLSTQSVTVSAVQYTLSFYGTGTVTLTGVSTSGPLVGTAEKELVTLTFTPTAGSLTLTVSGDVNYANLELGPSETSWIPTTSSAATRSADSHKVTGENFSPWYNSAEGTFVVEYVGRESGTAQAVVCADDGTVNNRISLLADASGSAGITQSFVVTVAGVNQVVASHGSAVGNIVHCIAASYKLNDFSSLTDYGVLHQDDVGTVPTVSQLVIGNNGGSTQKFSGTIKSITYYSKSLSDSVKQMLVEAAAETPYVIESVSVAAATAAEAARDVVLATALEVASDAADADADRVLAQAAAVAAAADRVLADTAKTISINNALAAATSAASIADYSARVQAKLKTRGITGIKGVVVSSAEGWEKQGQQSYKADTRPTGRFLGDYATATLAWAADYLGVATVTEDYYWNTTTDQQEKCTTSNLSTVTYRGSTDHMPLERAFVFTLTNLYVFDLTSPLMPLWKQFVNAANTLYGGAAAPDWTGVTRSAYFKDGRLIYGLSNGSSGKGLRIWDFKNDTTLHIGASAASAFAGTLASCNSALGMKTVATATASILQSGSVNGVVDVDGYIGVATDGGLSVVTPANAVIRSSSTNQFVFLTALRGRLYAVNLTASPDSLNDYGPAAALGASFVPVNTWTTTTVPALSDSTISGVVVAGDHLVIHGSTAVDELWPDPTTMANSLIARKTTTAATPPMKKPELMILAGTGTGSITPTDLITNGTFPTDVSSWTNQSSNTITWSAGAAVLTRAIGEGNENVAAQTISVVAGRTYLITYSGLTGVTGSNPFGIYLGASLLGQVTNNTPVAIRYTATTTGSATFYLAIIGSTPAGSPYVVGIDNVSMVEYAADRSGKSNHATPYGTVTLTAHATGGVSMASGFTVNTNYLSAPNPWASIGSGEGWLSATAKCAASAVEERIIHVGYWDGAANLNSIVMLYFSSSGQAVLYVSNDAGATSVTATSASTYDDGLVHTFLSKKSSTHYILEVDGKEVASVAVGAHGTLTFHASAVLFAGRNASGATIAPNSSIALVGAGIASLTASESAEIHKYMRNLIEGKAAFDELPSNLAYNELTDTIHCVGTTYEQTMRDGRVAVVGSHGVGTTPVIACGPRGEVSYGGSTNLTVSVPERNLQEAPIDLVRVETTFRFAGDASRVDFPTLTSASELLAFKGYRISAVLLNGSEMDTDDYTIQQGCSVEDIEFARFTSAPTATDIVKVKGYKYE